VIFYLRFQRGNDLRTNIGRIGYDQRKPLFSVRRKQIATEEGNASL
jgi:hypothetical protein